MSEPKLSTAQENREDLARDILNRLGIKGVDDKEVEVTTNEDIADFLVRTGGFAINRRNEIIETAKLHRIIEIREESGLITNIFNEQVEDEELESLGIDFEKVADYVQKRCGIEPRRSFLRQRLSGSDEATPII